MQLNIYRFLSTHFISTAISVIPWIFYIVQVNAPLGKCLDSYIDVDSDVLLLIFFAALVALHFYVAGFQNLIIYSLLNFLERQAAH